MKPGQSLPILLTLMILSLLFSGCPSSSNRSEPSVPNIILIISDDQSWTDYSFMGHPHVQTPHMDRLAREGLTLTRGYTVAPLCRPSLASIITGLYPHQHGILGNDPVFAYTGAQKWGADWLQERAVYNEAVVARIETGPCLPAILEEAGYRTLQTGKWWEGHFSRGGFTEGMTHGDPLREGRHGDEGLSIGRQGLERIYRFIDRSEAAGEPFFVWYAPFMPHAPHTPPDSLEEKYLSVAPTPAVARYWAMCEWFDMTCGQLADYIDRKGLSEETLIIFVADNGWIQDPERPNRYAARSKRSPYDTGIRTPIIFRLKNRILPELDTVYPAVSIDILPTLLHSCGLEVPDQLPGIDLLDIHERKERQAVFAENYTHDFTYADSSLLERVVISDRWKLILPEKGRSGLTGPELYDLTDDPMERRNLADQFPERVAGMTVLLESRPRIGFTELAGSVPRSSAAGNFRHGGSPIHRKLQENY